MATASWECGFVAWAEGVSSSRWCSGALHWPDTIRNQVSDGQCRIYTYHVSNLISSMDYGLCFLYVWQGIYFKWIQTYDESTSLITSLGWGSDRFDTQGADPSVGSKELWAEGQPSTRRAGRTARRITWFAWREQLCISWYNFHAQAACGDSWNHFMVFWMMLKARSYKCLG